MARFHLIDEAAVLKKGNGPAWAPRGHYELWLEKRWAQSKKPGATQNEG